MVALNSSSYLKKRRARLLWNLRLLREDLKALLLLIVVVAFSLLIAITVHEFSHALMAYRPN